MLLMGVWHGLSPHYLIYGAYHGLLLCANEYLDLHWKPFRKLKQSGWGRVVCILLTFESFSLGLLIFSGRLSLL
jgi:membrane protein involved in D-alanine export